MDIDVEISGLSKTTKRLLLRYQIAHLHFLMFASNPLAEERVWIDEYRNIEKALKAVPEKQIREVADKIERNRETKTELESSLGYVTNWTWELGEEVTELEHTLSRLSLRVGDVRPPFFKQIN